MKKSINIITFFIKQDYKIHFYIILFIINTVYENTVFNNINLDEINMTLFFKEIYQFIT